MAKQKRQSNQQGSSKRGAEIGDQLEHAFLAGLGALANAQKAGGKAFETLVEQGKSFRKETSDKTESLIDDVQGAIRSMADGAQTKATGLLDQMRETPQLDKLQSVFDDRVADTLDRLGVASKANIDDLNKKLDKVLASIAKQDRPVAKKATKRKVAKKTAKKATKKKPVTKKASKKRVTKKTAKKKVGK